MQKNSVALSSCMSHMLYNCRICCALNVPMTARNSHGAAALLQDELVKRAAEGDIVKSDVNMSAHSPEERAFLPAVLVGRVGS